MAQGDAKGIRLIGLQWLLDIQQYGNHVLHLRLVSRAFADHGLLDFARCVFSKW